MIRLLSGDARDVLPTLPAESVQCVVTSPAYYGLRDYGTALWDGGDATCSHMAVGTDRGAREGLPKPPAGWAERAQGYANGRYCTRCGAVRVDRQIGLESTPEAYLQTMVAVFREVWRVLRRDGTCWVNMGDSYAAGISGHVTGPDGRIRPGKWDDTTADDRTFTNKPFSTVGNGYKPKDLMLMPARLALALQADGWWVRSDIIWHKPNPMPESTRDRPTSAHEHVFLLTRSGRYYYDADAVRERVGEETRRATEFRGENTPYKDHQSESNSGWVATYAPRGEPSLSGRNMRNVWTLSTESFSGAHFATFPSALAERCIRAGSSERGCCAGCGKPWVRVTEREATTCDGRARPSLSQSGETHRGDCDSMQRSIAYNVTTTGWSPGCQCGTTEPRPCVVLDPFAGAGTTLLVADRLQRDAVGVELNTAYTEMAMERVRADAPLFTSFPPAEDPEEARMGDLFAGDEYERATPSPKPLQVPRGWDTGPGAHGTIHRTGRTLPEAAE